MILKIIVNKIDYSEVKLAKIAELMQSKATYFEDNNEEREMTATFTGSNISKLSQCVRSINKIGVDL